MPKVGAHVSAAGSIDLSFERAQAIGADCTQIFISPPQRWLETNHSQEVIDRYKSRQVETNIGPNFIHGTYLINLGTENQENLKKAIGWLTYALNRAGELGITGVIFHTGSHKGVGFDEVLPQIVKSIKQILKQTTVIPSKEGIQKTDSGSEEAKLATLRSMDSRLHGNDDNNPFLILENAAGAGNVIGDKFEELAVILKEVGDPRLKICLDTCHTFVSGYDIKSKAGLDKTLEEFDKLIGLDKLVAIHANDAKFDIGSNRDRHANIGEGFIGKDGFKNLVNHPKLKDIPFILEVPGFADTGPDKENVNILKSLI